MKYIDADRLRAEIEKEIEGLQDLRRGCGLTEYGCGRWDALRLIDSIIDSIKQEQPSERFEKELAKVIVEVVDNKDGDGPSLKEYAKRLFASAHSVPFVLEQPEVNLEKEIEKYYYDNFAFISSAHTPTKDIVSDIATHFYERGQKNAANKFDEIEYNRQKAEEENK